MSEGAHVRVVGAVRSQKGEKHVMVFRIGPVEAQEEVNAHRLEVRHAKLKIRQLVNKEMEEIGAAAPSTANASDGASFGHPKRNMVYKMLQGCVREEGLHRNDVFEGLQGKMNQKEVDEALTYLSDEGHIYSTMDEDHFKTTDG